MLIYDDLSSQVASILVSEVDIKLDNECIAWVYARQHVLSSPIVVVLLLD